MEMGTDRESLGWFVVCMLWAHWGMHLSYSIGGSWAQAGQRRRGVGCAQPSFCLKRLNKTKGFSQPHHCRWLLDSGRAGEESRLLCPASTMTPVSDWGPGTWPPTTVWVTPGPRGGGRLDIPGSLLGMTSASLIFLAQIRSASSNNSPRALSWGHLLGGALFRLPKTNQHITLHSEALSQLVWSLINIFEPSFRDLTVLFFQLPFCYFSNFCKVPSLEIKCYSFRL